MEKISKMTKKNFGSWKVKYSFTKKQIPECKVNEISQRIYKANTHIILCI